MKTRLISHIVLLASLGLSTAFAEDSLCNHLLGSDSSKVDVAIHDLAKLRYDLDRRLEQGLNDLVTRALKREFEKKWIDVLNASRLGPDDLLSGIRVKIQKIQKQAEIEIIRQSESVQDVVSAEHRIESGESLDGLPIDSNQILSKDGRILRIGGVKKGSSSIDLVDPITGKSEKIGFLNVSRSQHTQSMLLDGRVLIAGGLGNRYLVEVIDPTTGKSEEIARLTESRCRHAQSTLPDGRVLITGGEDSWKASATLEWIDPIAKTAERIGRLKEARYSHTQMVLPDGRILVVGGRGRNGQLSSIELIDPVSKTSEKVGDLKVARSAHAQTLLPDGRILVSGGIGENGFLSSVELIDLSTWESELILNLKIARSSHFQGISSDGRVAVWGGDGRGGAVSTVEWIQVGRK